MVEILKSLAKWDFEILYRFQIILVIYYISLSFIADTMQYCNPNATNLTYILLKGLLCTMLIENRQLMGLYVVLFMCVSKRWNKFLLINLKAQNHVTYLWDRN